jgi:hypothetical protein
MSVKVTLILALLVLALIPATAQGHAIVPCSTKQSVDRQMKCGKLNVHHGKSTLKFLRNHPKAGTWKSRVSVKKGAKYLIRYGNRHIRKASDRRLGTMPSAIYTDSCLRELIRREASGFVPEDKSTWFAAAKTPNSQGLGAYGIPQALPGSKMASAGSDWSWNPVTQVRWMIGYVNGRYGGSCAALAHHNAAGYY